jgi:hypothetical protein
MNLKCVKKQKHKWAFKSDLLKAVEILCYSYKNGDDTEKKPDIKQMCFLLL